MDVIIFAEMLVKVDVKLHVEIFVLDVQVALMVVQDVALSV